MATVLISGVAIFFLLMGLVAFAITERFGGYCGFATLPDGRNEIRAVYGGFGLAMGVLLFASLAMPDAVRSGILLTLAVGMFAMAAARIVSIFIDEMPGFFPGLFFIVEVLIGGALLIAR